MLISGVKYVTPQVLSKVTLSLEKFRLICLVLCDRLNESLFV